MLSPYTEGRHDPLLQELGARSLARYDALVARLRADGYGVRYSRDGSIELALDETRADALAQESAALTRDGVAHTLQRRRAVARADARARAGHRDAGNSRARRGERARDSSRRCGCRPSAGARA